LKVIHNRSEGYKAEGMGAGKENGAAARGRRKSMKYRKD
jgi:hypothetical protein